ncbi:MAG: efflux RND transporter periplasmic adaptor subunit [Thermodesulfobacteriota bacterium]
MKPILLTALILAMLGAGTIFIISGLPFAKNETSQEKKSPKAPVVEVTTAKKTSVSRRLELSGTVEAYQVARLASPAEGPVRNIRVREGDKVSAGTKLMDIGRKQGAEALVTSLLEELEKEKKNLNRIQRLVNKDAIAEEELDQAKTAYEQVRAQLVQARESAEDYTITAPWDGVVSRLEVKEGEFAVPRAVLMEMYDPDSLVIRAAAPERYAAEIKADMRVDIRLDAYPKETVQGRITRIYPYLDSGMRTRTMEIVPNESLALLPGMFARLQVVLEEQDVAVVVPKEAIVSTPEGKAVFVVQEGKAEKREVQTGIEEEKHTQIVSGLNTGEKVVVSGNQKLKPGVAVRLEQGKKPAKKESGDGTEQPAKQKGKAGDEQQ